MTDEVLLPGQWKPEKAWRWYNALPWRVGFNYIPSDTGNQLEMFQKETFNRDNIIDKELAFAKSMGMNTVRVYLHDLLWQYVKPEEELQNEVDIKNNEEAIRNNEGFKNRIREFLKIANRHHMKTIFVFFDSCWGENPDPQLGPQPEAGNTHMSTWRQSPSKADLVNPAQYPRLKQYVQGIIKEFRGDRQILAWDVWNEPDSSQVIGAFGDQRAVTEKQGNEAVERLLPQVFEWAREAGATQPLTSGVCTTATKDGDWRSYDTLTPIEKIQISESDFISFHNYGNKEDFEKRVTWLENYGRPIICMEFLARKMGSTFEEIYPVAHRHNVGILNWGFINGKIKTHLAWGEEEEEVAPDHRWFHDIAGHRKSGTHLPTFQALESHLRELEFHLLDGFETRLHALEPHLHAFEPHDIKEFAWVVNFIAQVRQKEREAENKVQRSWAGGISNGQAGFSL